MKQATIIIDGKKYYSYLENSEIDTSNIRLITTTSDNVQNSVVKKEGDMSLHLWEEHISYCMKHDPNVWNFYSKGDFTVVVYENIETGEKDVGIAKRRHTDEPNYMLGRLIAYCRATGHSVCKEIFRA